MTLKRKKQRDKEKQILLSQYKIKFSTANNTSYLKIFRCTNFAILDKEKYVGKFQRKIYRKDKYIDLK